MKKSFAEYYNLSEECIKDIWEDSLIVFDTNVLLNLYRHNVETQKEFINVIKFYEERLWIPYQVGLEFHRNREDRIRKNKAAYQTLKDSLSEEIKKALNTVCSKSDFARHPYIDVDEIKKKIERCISSIAKSLDKQENEHPDNLTTDNILNNITELFEGRVGKDFSDNELETLYKEGEKRYNNQIPPGYCDEKNKNNKPKRNLYGDLIIWKQIIKHSKTVKRNIIFITDDHKKDWWDKIEGKHSPRKELIKEFKSETGQSILMYDSSYFLIYAKQNKTLKIKQKTIDSVTRFLDEHRMNLACINNTMEYINAWHLQMESIKKQFNSFYKMDETIKKLASMPTLAMDVSKLASSITEFKELNLSQKTKDYSEASMLLDDKIQEENEGTGAYN